MKETPFNYVFRKLQHRLFNHGLARVGWDWLALVGVGGRATPAHPEKTALHTKSSQTAGLEAIWCEVSRKILRNTPVWWLFRL
ncbi:hypothetical protein BUE67_05915 [Corynebacterium diphtheriae]|nr:hypothetical protein BUE67_05915 [Corynebacterium diphtheriae]